MSGRQSSVMTPRQYPAHAQIVPATVPSCPQTRTVSAYTAAYTQRNPGSGARRRFAWDTAGSDRVEQEGPSALPYKVPPAVPFNDSFRLEDRSPEQGALGVFQLVSPSSIASGSIAALSSFICRIAVGCGNRLTTTATGENGAHVPDASRYIYAP